MGLSEVKTYRPRGGSDAQRHGTAGTVHRNIAHPAIRLDLRDPDLG
jgi:hypothetical protein